MSLLMAVLLDWDLRSYSSTERSVVMDEIKLASLHPIGQTLQLIRIQLFSMQKCI